MEKTSIVKLESI